MLNTGVSGETVRPFGQPLEGTVLRGDTNAVPTAENLLDASSLEVPIGVANKFPAADIRSGGGCTLGSSDTWDNAGIKVWLGDRQVITGTRPKHMRSTVWRRTLFTAPLEQSAFVDGDCVRGAASMAGSIPAVDDPGAVKATLSKLRPAGVPGGQGEASGRNSNWCGTVDDPQRASDGAGEDEGLMIQSLIENAEDEVLRSASKTGLSFPRVGERGRHESLWKVLDCRSLPSSKGGAKSGVKTEVGKPRAVCPDEEEMA